MTVRLLLLPLLCLCSLRAAHADLNQYMIRTTEWLVDHSRVICVATFDEKDQGSNGKVLATIKGDASAVTWPLKTPAFDGYHYYGPPTRGTVRLLFIGDNQELWQSVEMGRYPIDSPTLHDVFYGVDQYGKVHLTESSLVDSIRAHIDARASKAVTRRKTSPHFSRSGIEAPPTFPLENGGETFVLVVDFTEKRRDYYLEQLKSGDCAERLHAIKELSELNDPQAYAAIEAATRASGVEPSYSFDWSDRRVHMQADAQVQTAASETLNKLNQKQ